jgi:hypothetical protein
VKWLPSMFDVWNDRLVRGHSEALGTLCRAEAAVLRAWYKMCEAVFSNEMFSEASRVPVPALHDRDEPVYLRL